MRERAAILAAFDELTRAGQLSAIATVVAVEGSSYRRPGARMLIAADGRTWGGVSGGCLERDVARVGRTVIDSGLATLKRYETAVDDDWQDQPADAAASLGCGGAIEILIERVSTEDAAPIEALRSSYLAGAVDVVATIFRVGGSIPAGVGERLRLNDAPPPSEAAAAVTVELCLMADRSLTLSKSDQRGGSVSRRHVFADGWIDVLYERFLPPQTLIIFGDGPDVSPVVELGRMLGWRVIVVGVRSEAVLRERFPSADTVIHWHGPLHNCADDARDAEADALAAQSFESAAVVVMQHNLARDAAALRRVGRHRLAYLGLLGPQHRTRRILDALPAGDATSIELHSPIGLDIGAEGPEQIALAVIAEIQAALAGRNAEPLTAVARRDLEPAK